MLFALLLLGATSLLPAEVALASEISATQQTSSIPHASALCEADLPAAIETIIRRPEFARAQWGILVEPIDSERPLYALNERAYFLPASTVKLLTTAAALEHFGADYRIRTPIYTAGEPPILKTLLVTGRGDPSLQTAQLQRLAEQIEGQGVRQIEELIVEDRYFQESNRHPNWELEDVYFAYAPAVNSLILNQNQFALTFSASQIGAPVQLSWQDDIAASQWQMDNETVTTATESDRGIQVQGIWSQPVLQFRGSLAIDTEPITWDIAILNPTQYFLAVLRSRLEAEGIVVNRARIATPRDNFSQLRNQSKIQQRDWTWRGNLAVPRAQNLKSKIEMIESAPLAILIQETNQASNNLYAEALLHILGASTGREDTLDAGLITIQQTLTSLGVDPESYRLADGSGLSRHNLLSPEAIVQTLQQMARSPQASAYLNSLAIAGVSGTLQKRFQNTPVEGNLRGKTGTLRGVSALSGYLDVPNGRSLVFSIVLNRSSRSASEQRSAIDEIVLALSQLKSCSTSSGERRTTGNLNRSDRIGSSEAAFDR